MNILVKTAGGKVIVRPDTTWEKDSEDLYLPDCYTRLSFTPVLFAHITKPGRSIVRRFASRYYDTISYGVLLYPEEDIDGSEEGFAVASCLDHTSFLQYPVQNPSGVAGKSFVLKTDGYEVFSTSEGTAAMIEDALTEATSRIYIRTGDLIAIELQSRKIVMEGRSKNLGFKGELDGAPLFDFNVIVE